MFCLRNGLVIVTSILYVLKWLSLKSAAKIWHNGSFSVLDLLVTVVFHLFLLRGDPLLTH